MRTKLTLTSAAALAVTLTLGACAGMPDNASLNSTKQPVVERSNFALDVSTGYEGIPLSEQQRVAAWFETIDLKYGDRVSVDDPTSNPGVREDLAALAGRYGLLIADGVPVTPGELGSNQARIVVSRSMASVPGCPDWSARSDMNYKNATSSNYGCATNSNWAAMVANPEDMIRGQQGTGETVILTSTKAIKAYRDQEPTGVEGLPETKTTEGDN